MAPYAHTPSQAQLVAIAITPKVTGLLSILGNGYIIRDCYQQLNKVQRGRGGTLSSSGHTYQRLMIGMSLSNSIMSFGFVLSTLPMPKDTTFAWRPMGNTQTCTFAGCLTMMGVTPVMYNASLSIYYLLRIRYGWTFSQLVRVERWLHVVPWVWGISAVIVGVVMKLFNAGHYECWLAPFPQACMPTYLSTPDNLPTCTRGDNVALYQWGLDMIPKLVSILIVTINMYRTWRSVNRQEQQTKKFALNHHDGATTEQSHSQPQQTRSSAWLPRTISSRGMTPQTAAKLSLAQKLARQSYYYVGALYIMISPVIVARLFEELADDLPWGALYPVTVLVPLQGFLNLLVYLRPRYLQYRLDQAKLKAAQTSSSDAADDNNNTDSTPPIIALRSSSTSNNPFHEALSAARATSFPSIRRSILGTIRDTLRDGGIDEETLLALAEEEAASETLSLRKSGGQLVCQDGSQSINVVGEDATDRSNLSLPLSPQAQQRQQSSSFGTNGDIIVLAPVDE